MKNKNEIVVIVELDTVVVYDLLDVRFASRPIRVKGLSDGAVATHAVNFILFSLFKQNLFECNFYSQENIKQESLGKYNHPRINPVSKVEEDTDHRL